uniref:Cyphokinin n=1 Tax=Cyphononyx dorsalis TaxID=246266 RepID=BRKC_CYPDO|nr:RecName: Full=Cyphokinin; AltName: Full=Bradykinin-related peptide; Contains: RecName: Full=Thr6-bradykinin; Short=Thr6-BK [Cyphononyx dorsalis]
DTRPPGFTPFR